MECFQDMDVVLINECYWCMFGNSGVGRLEIINICCCLGCLVNLNGLFSLLFGSIGLDLMGFFPDLALFEATKS